MFGGVCAHTQEHVCVCGLYYMGTNDRENSKQNRGEIREIKELIVLSN